MSSKAIVVGAGIAGLAAAIRLAVQGFEVSVFEKNQYPGGKLSHFELGGYQFDAGPSLFTQPENVEALFELAGEPIAAYFNYQSLPIACKYFWEDGTIVNAFTNAAQFAEELATANGEDRNAVIDYLQQSENVYDNIGKLFVDYSLHRKEILWKAPITKAIAAVKSKHIFGSLHRLNAKHFKSAKTVQLFDRYATYNGSNPYKAPGMLSLIPHLEQNQGTFYPQGGMITITNGLYQLALKKGVQFYFETPVTAIIEHEGQVKGVVANHDNYYADVVVSNMDVYFTYKHLLKNEVQAKKILQQERSSSAIIFYWGIKKEFKQLHLHNIFFSDDYQKEFDHIFRLKQLYQDPTVYINITSKCEPGVQAPVGKENWFVMVNAPANVGQDWEQLRATARQQVIAKLSRLLGEDIESLIEVEQTLDPVTIESATSSYMGSLYGTSSNSKMAAFLRHSNFTKAIKGLYFVGGSVHPGGGIPLCLKSAKIMSELVAKDIKTVQAH
jgi:phytoene desaturase